MSRRNALYAMALVAAVSTGTWWLGSGSEANLDVEALGFRYRLADGTPVFDADALPRLRLRLPLVSEPVVRWQGPASTIDARHRMSAGDGPIVEVSSWLTAPASGPGTLIVRSGDRVARLTAQWAERPEDIGALSTLIEARNAGDTKRFQDSWSVLDRSRFEADLWAGVERARYFQQRDDTESTVSAWLEAAADADRLGVSTEAARRLRAAAFAAWRGQRSAQMMALLDRAEVFDLPDGDPAGHAHLVYRRGQLAYLMSDWRAARSGFELAHSDFARLGDRKMKRITTEALALLLVELGDPQRALQVLQALEAELDASDSGTRVRYAMNLGWVTLRALPDTPTEAQKRELRARLDAGRQATRGLGNALDTANAAVNQAWGALKLGELNIAETRLEEARLLDPDGEGYAASYATLLQARVDLARGRLDAAEAGFRALEARARHEQGEVSELGWRARFGLGRVSRARGDRAAARGHFDHALGIVDALGRRAALRGDRATFHADRGALVDEAIDLTAEHEPWRAFGYADAARARPMRALQADVRVGALDPPTRRRWAEALDAARAAAEAARDAHARLKIAPLAEEADRRRAADAADAAREAAFDAAFAVLDTATPAPTGIDGAALSRLLVTDEVLFAFHRRWAFRVDAAGTIARPLPAGDPLGDWRDLPPTVSHVYIVPGGHPKAFRLATAGARPLIERASVSFVPYAGLLQRPAESGDGAPLVIADARRDLAHAAAEGQSVASTLSGARLLRGDAADRASVLAALAETRLFHFAGHGVLHPERPWDAYLRLAGDDVLSLSDVLTHPLGARLVVLSGCETGVDAVLLDESVVGLPEAFLAAGAGAVLATDRPVDDRATRRFIDRFYAAGGADDPAGGLRRAALTTRDAGDQAWHAFRLIGARRAVGQAR